MAQCHVVSVTFRFVRSISEHHSRICAGAHVKESSWCKEAIRSCLTRLVVLFAGISPSLDCSDGTLRVLVMTVSMRIVWPDIFSCNTYGQTDS